MNKQHRMEREYWYYHKKYVFCIAY